MTLTVAPIDDLIDEVAFECQVFPERIRSNHRTPAAVRARWMVAFIAHRDLDLSPNDIAAHLGVPARSVRRHIAEAEREARSDVFFSAQLYSLRRSR